MAPSVAKTPYTGKRQKTPVLRLTQSTPTVRLRPLYFMFGTIRKHQTWLWVFIIAIMIFGLIQWQNSLGKSGSGGRGGGDFGVIDGRPITETEMRHAQMEADLSYFLNTGTWPETGAPRQGWNQTVENYKQV